MLDVYHQPTSSMCGYHALHNAKIWLEGVIKGRQVNFLGNTRNCLNTVTIIRLPDEENFWVNFHAWYQFLLKNASDQAQIDFKNDYLW